MPAGHAAAPAVPAPALHFSCWLTYALGLCSLMMSGDACTELGCHGRWACSASQSTCSTCTTAHSSSFKVYIGCTAKCVVAGLHHTWQLQPRCVFAACLAVHPSTRGACSCCKLHSSVNDQATNRFTCGLSTVPAGGVPSKHTASSGVCRAAPGASWPQAALPARLRHAIASL